ncbi:hypothetical protein [Vibrio mimicus]|uniref:hypothetical protein n=1 Tax=Vibrio mimicus TaxID=674 RepID=UPI00076B874B|nr:hypothetical protein [Vibrio mimicus]AMG03802.1 hypothetical protein AL543_12750 [Vibrio mimicus]KAA3491290.1 hypothetical protein Y058_17195 [Vibrio mimicus]
MSQQVQVSKVRAKKGIGRHYNSYWDVLSRSLLAMVAGYMIAGQFTIFVSTAPFGNVVINVMSATQYSFLVMAAIVILAFCAQSARKAWSISTIIFIVLLVATGVNHVF